MPTPTLSTNIDRPSSFSTSNHTQQLMADAEMSEDGKKESRPLQIDPKWYVQSHFLTRIPAR